MLASLGYAVLLVPAMQLTNVIGFSRTLSFGMLFSIAQFALLYFTNAGNAWYLLPLVLMCVILFRLFHWVPYHVDFTAFTRSGERGKDVSLMLATIAFMVMVGPLLSGYIVANSGYSTLFAVGVVLLILSAVSYWFVPAVAERFTWSYRQTLSELFSPAHRNLLLGEAANGAEVIVTLVAWPIFIYTVLNGNVLDIGMISTVIVGVTIVLQLIAGHYIDKSGDNKISALKRGSLLAALGWLFKIFVVSTMQIFLVGLYHNIAKIFSKTPYSAILYDMTGEQGEYIDEYTVMREMASHFGRAAALGAMIVLTLYVPIEVTFLIGVVASLAVNFIYQRYA